MGDVSAGLYGIEKVFGRQIVPSFKILRFWQVVEGIIKLDGVKMLCIVLEPFVFWQVGRIKRSCPVAVMPAGCAYSDVAFYLAHKKYFNTLNNF